MSSDSDFTRLAARLREAGKIVVGMGERKTPAPFIAACNKFRFLEVLQQAQEAEAAGEAAKKEAKPRIKKAVKATVDAEEEAVKEVVAAVETPYEEPAAAAEE